MNELDWTQQIQWQDHSEPVATEAAEEVYTLYISDFLKMPEIDYSELVDLDPQVKALLN